MESNDSVFYSSSEGSQNNNWLKFQASVKSGNLVEDADGPLMICCQYEPLLCSDDHDLRHIHQISEQETPLDLSSVIKLEMKEEVVTREEKDQDSGYNPSPPLVDLTDTPDEDLRQLVRGPPDSILRLYPYLRLTNTGALVLWNFLWALLQDINKRSIVRWVSVIDLEFQIVSKSLLAETWGSVKTQQSMDWSKILELYLRKKLIKLCSAEAKVYQFLIVPKHVKQDELCIL